jgi:hypothetical protein
LLKIKDAHDGQGAKNPFIRKSIIKQQKQKRTRASKHLGIKKNTHKSKNKNSIELACQTQLKVIFLIPWIFTHPVEYFIHCFERHAS